jgi:hypothetical protein
MAIRVPATDIALTQTPAQGPPGLRSRGRPSHDLDDPDSSRRKDGNGRGADPYERSSRPPTQPQHRHAQANQAQLTLAGIALELPHDREDFCYREAF